MTAAAARLRGSGDGGCTSCDIARVDRHVRCRTMHAHRVRAHRATSHASIDTRNVADRAGRQPDRQPDHPGSPTRPAARPPVAARSPVA
ncbi:hypothetical protein Cus16_3167 [Curtobacterium sp. ER1/6]|nr:hypothetical protein Cus16_3167 [Curtobacterium sp. ER1/6]